MLRMFWRAAAIVFIAGVGGQNQVDAAEQGAASAKPKNPVKVTAESVAAGQGVFQKYCRFCHGADATGNGPLAPKGTNPPNLVDSTWDHGSTDGDIFLAIRDGIGPKFDMKPNKDKISEQDIWNVVNYLRSLGAAKK
jgi:mono/diheme cytochrome c family protein